MSTADNSPSNLDDQTRKILSLKHHFEQFKRDRDLVHDSFRKDFLHTEFWPPKYDICDLPTTLVGHQLMKYAKFRTVVDQFAWRMYLNLRKNPDDVLLLFRDLELNAEPVGLVLYKLPEYHEPQWPSAFHKFKTSVMPFVFKLRKWWKFCTFEDILQPAEMIAELRDGDKMCQATKSDKKMSLLQSISREALYHECYPKPMSICIGLFGIRSDQQGKGLGKKIMDMTIEHIKEQGLVVEPPFNGPAKLQLSASPVGINFYKKYGFTIGAEHPKKLKSGRVLTHTLFYINLK